MLLWDVTMDVNWEGESVLPLAMASTYIDSSQKIEEKPLLHHTFQVCKEEDYFKTTTSSPQF